MLVRVAETDHDINRTFNVMKQLRPHLEEATYGERVRQQQAHGYRLIFIEEEGAVRAVSGYRISFSLAWGKFLYVDDLITDEANRSQGYARQLLDYIEEEASREQCAALHLDSGVQRHDAHRLYLNTKMRISCHHFEKNY